VCKLDDEIITAGVFLIGSGIMEYHLSASYDKGKETGSVYLLIHDAALRGKQLGCHTLHLGGGTNNNPDNPLLFFKSRFSPLRGSFKIGKKIHASQPYNHMKKEWRAKQGSESNRILFYR
jgi:lipid II:glycine glycyltransferase (peptidoglycan interpeptide bridge formation enzyme)